MRFFREHAVWAHLDYGIRAVIAPSFGPIFFDNALKNGLVLVTLAENEVSHITQRLQVLESNSMTVSLAAQTVVGPDAQIHPFIMDTEHRSNLLNGTDEIQRTVDSLSAIDAFESADRSRRPWIWDGA